MTKTVIYVKIIVKAEIFNTIENMISVNKLPVLFSLIVKRQQLFNSKLMSVMALTQYICQLKCNELETCLKYMT